MNLRIDSPGKTSAFVDSLPNIHTAISRKVVGKNACENPGR